MRKKYEWPSVTFSVLGLLLSVGALVVSLIALRDTHHQTLFSIKPTVYFSVDSDPDDPPVGVSMNNAGPAPAIIKSVKYFIDGQLVDGVEQVIERGKLDDNQTQRVDLGDGDAIAVGEKIWVISHRKHLKEDQKELERFGDLINNHLAIKVEYQSVIKGQRWASCSAKDQCPN